MDHGWTKSVDVCLLATADWNRGQKPEVQVLVVFAKDNFGRTGAVDLEDADTTCLTLRTK